jgi:hypothetical protein
MNRARLLVALTLPLAAAGALAAQATPARNATSWTRPVTRYGKWVTAATAIGFTALAAREHQRSADAWDLLVDICRADFADCATGPDGRYLNGVTEQHYQRSLYYDARARRRLLAGQLSLLVSAVFFLADLRRGQSDPENIPFDPDKLVFTPDGRGGALVGLRLPL